MIKPTELRLGNHIHCNKKFVNDIHEVNLSTFAQVKDDWENQTYLYEPIPLTEEILFRAGFSKHENEFFWNERAIIVWLEVYERYGYELGKHKHRVMESLHELQNLFFSITGEELKINLP